MQSILQWLGQGGYLLACGATRLAIDPYLSDSLYALKNGDPGFRRMTPPPIPPQALAADALVATHAHADHLDPETVVPAAERVGLFLGPDSCVRKYEGLGIPTAKIRPLNRGQTVALGPLRLEAVYACHTEDSIGLCVRAPEGLCYFVGDSLLDERMLAQALRPDLLLCCINGRLGNMDAEEAAALAQALAPKAAIPCHYGLLPANTADPARFREALEGSGIRCVILEPGRPYALAALMGGEGHA